MTAAQHHAYATRFAQEAEELAAWSQLAAERGDTGASLRHQEERADLLELAEHHREQAAAKTLAAVELGAGPRIEGLTDGPVFHLGRAFPTDESMHG